MRGPSQKIDITEEIVDKVLDNEDIQRIDSLLFSGGEPTLNPKIIIYTINKIIRNNLDVCNNAMVTNGQVYSQEIVDAFNRFHDYRNKRLLWNDKEYKDNAERMKEIINNSQMKHTRITVSNDQFHLPISNKIKEEYQKNANGTRICETNEINEEEIYKTGFSMIGSPFEYKLAELRYFNESNSYYILEWI